MRRISGRVCALLTILVLATNLAPLAFASHGGAVPTGHIDTIAGGPGAGPAIRLQLHAEDMHLDGDRLFFVDQRYNVVRRLDLAGPEAGNVTVVAGVGGYDFNQGVEVGPSRQPELDSTGDSSDADALAHRFGQISAITTDGEGRLYIADVYKDLVWRVETDGTLTRIAGNRDAEAVDSDYSVDPIDDASEVATGTDALPARRSVLGDPAGLAVDDGGDLFISEAEHYRIRKVDAETGAISTFVGPPVASQEVCRDLHWATYEVRRCPVGIPSDLAFDRSGNLIVGAEWPGAVFSIAPDKTITELDRGIVNGPVDIATDQDAVYYVRGGPAADELVRLDSSGVTTSTPMYFEDETATIFGIGAGSGRVFVSGASVRNEFPWYSSYGIFEAVDDGTVRVAGVRFDQSGGDGGPADDAQLVDPSDVVRDGAGNLYVTSRDTYDVRRISCNGTIGSLTVPRAFVNDRATVVQGVDSEAYLLMPEALYRIDPTTAQLTTEGTWSTPIHGIDAAVVDGAGRLILSQGGHFYSMDPATGEEQVISLDSEEGTLAAPDGLAIDAVGNLLLASARDGGIFEMSATDSGYATPRRIAGVDGGLRFSSNDPDGARVTTERLVHTLTEASTEPGTATDTYMSPQDVAVTQDGGILIADTGLNRILRLDRDTETLSLVAGVPPPDEFSVSINGSTGDLRSPGGDGFRGDGRPATESHVEPVALVSDASGNVVFVEELSERLRYVAGDAAVLACNDPVTKVATAVTYIGSLEGRGSAVDMVATLTTVARNPLEGQWVVFTVAGQTYEALTDAEGIARATGLVPDHGKSQTVTVSFAGTERLEESSTTATIVWGKTKGQ